MQPISVASAGELEATKTTRPDAWKRTFQTGKKIGTLTKSNKA
uniref:Uncharacterized protein n=1 Tax=Anguilla anguilla TaxID=7936 RepID=A0A0E9U8Y6_ANGAN